ncbi:beta-glucosidase [Pseudomonas sp. DC3000-4b1]|uniref:beta-glucosidase n=1 Tax=unclassified Pseudomonas TaxID=196821 RepID=UPI003CF7BE79
MHRPELLASFVMGGFECSSCRRADGRRLDLLASTGHARHAEADYLALRAEGIATVRDGLRWHLIEQRPGVYDWSSFDLLLDAAERTGTQVIWDICHYGYPDDLDIWQPAFVERFARFAGEAARHVRERSDSVPFYCPINEISFWAWAGGDVSYFNPSRERRGMELKHQLVRASIAAIEAIRAVEPRARFVQADPLINVVPAPDRPQDGESAESYRQAQFEAWDLLSGRAWPGLGGREAYLDILGLNFYPHNQWYLGGAQIPRGHPDYRPFLAMLKEAHLRYGRPMIITETGAEGDGREPWLDYMGEQVDQALAAGVPLEGLCLYPVLDYPGWDDDRHCHTGLLGFPDAQGCRPVHAGTRQALKRLAERIGDHLPAGLHGQRVSA